MSKLTDEQAMAIGRAVHKELCKDKPGNWPDFPKIIFAEFGDHHRRLYISSFPDRVAWSEPHENETSPTEIKFPEMFPLESD